MKRTIMLIIGLIISYSARCQSTDYDFGKNELGIRVAGLGTFYEWEITYHFFQNKYTGIGGSIGWWSAEDTDYDMWEHTFNTNAKDFWARYYIKPSIELCSPEFKKQENGGAFCIKGTCGIKINRKFYSYEYTVNNGKETEHKFTSRFWAPEAQLGLYYFRYEYGIGLGYSYSQLETKLNFDYDNAEFTTKPQHGIFLDIMVKF